MWFNSKNGYIDNKLKYIRHQQKCHADISEVPDGSNNQRNIDKIDESKITDDLSFLKTTVVTIESLPLIKEKLINTQKYRVDLLKDHELDLLENVPFFFSNPDLVSQFFDE